ncbi:RING finger and CHY zinc finger domain-containing protein 1 [Smittium mucronatum]|uniref:RING finger and CHY zinc finger domain-containing protein 1 n=1 Tax=Smittium mucronatum TaxID=133383 RepID=A0A1R0H414_9FUNG|nr:RING finger and CHY zinc finger domain-containing protein 1 [Smittium mucronatum]
MVAVQVSDVLSTQIKNFELPTGCSHYNIRAKIKAPCCGNFYWCRLCHDESENHEINRFDVSEMQCQLCHTLQPIGLYCVSCNSAVADYYCDICKLLTNNFEHIPSSSEDPEHKIISNVYHCDKCGICRKGKREDFFHCDNCSACLSIDLYENHICIENNLRSNCPICMENLFTSTENVVILACGHPIHQRCANELVSFSDRMNETIPTCPLCHKSIIEPSIHNELMDRVLASQPMPEEYKSHKSLIFCNDCRTRSTVPYHFVYHKCTNCGSYNTTIRSQLH